ncbi:MAG: tRNA pseudouridine(55) synthase TruB [Flavobacteriaceae bacterium]
MSRRRASPVHGWLVLDKPEGMTSTAAVGRLKRLFSSRKAGHAGTLDPLASGCLPIAFGEATKTVPFLVDARKTYRFSISWGVATETLDREGKVTGAGGPVPDDAAIDRALPDFIGMIDQVPPAYSAILVNGERAYDLARAGETVELKARPVRIFSLHRTGPTEGGETPFECICGKGTYIRAIARDLAAALGTQGHISALRREAVGPFGPADMISLEKLEELRHKGANQGGPVPDTLVNCIRGLETALDDIPALAVTEADVTRLRNGQAIILKGRDAPIVSGRCLLSCRGKPVAIGRGEAGLIRPERVFNLSGN